MLRYTKRLGIRGLYGWIFTWILLLLVFTVSRSESSDVLNLHLEFSQDHVVTGGRLGVVMVVEMSDPWHVYAPGDEGAYTIPIEPGLKFEGADDSSLEWIYPEPEYLRMAGADEPAAVYGGTFILQTEITVPKEADEEFTLVGSLYFQACDDRHCLFPSEEKVEATLPIRGRSDQIQKTNISNLDAAQAEAEGTAEEESGEISALLEDYGLLITLFLIFLGGLALNLTPCVYPLIPITISFFGGVDASRRGKTFWKALAYVLGIAVTYSVLGVVAALGGGLFGALLTHPAVLIGISVVLVGLSLSMFGVYEFRLPSGLMNAAGQTKSGIIGSLFMGLTMGIIAAPCVGPLVIGLLTYVAMRQSVVLGFLVFLKDKKRPIYQIFGLLTLSVAFWSISYSIWLLADSAESALFWSRALNLGATFIPILLLHWIIKLLKRRGGKILVVFYAITFIFAIFSFSPFYIKGTKQIFQSAKIA